MLGKLTKLFGNSDEKVIERLQPIVEEINALEDKYQNLSDLQLSKVTDSLKDSYTSGQTLDDLLPQAFALVREAAKRVLQQRHYDVQLIGGIVLHQGKIAEMRTGEGKTLVATLPAYLNALTGEGVHVITVNDYLAKRDAEWMSGIYSMLGISVAALQHDTAFLLDSFNNPEQSTREIPRADAYKADITYGTNNEFGFDYLRDNMVDHRDQRVQGGRAFAIVDEVDNILIDEARTPLIISGPSQQNPNEYIKFASIAPRLTEEEDYELDEKHKSVALTADGIAKVENLLGVENLYDSDNFGQVHFLENAVRAHVVYQRDREYVVRGGQVLIVDEFTGRMMEGRRYSDGLHQAIEAKEKLRVQRESVTYATITLQNYFRLYEKLSGMTGTAATEAEEFWKIYQLEVTSIPTHRPVTRVDHPDLIYRDQESKYNAVVEEIVSKVEIGQPVLVGTTDIDKSELISRLLKRKGVSHNVLNAKQHNREANIVAEAGAPSAVTVATNMAGRGTDIVLGGNQDSEEIDQDEWVQKHKRVVDVGGLCIIGTERHEARRIDNQLRGRSGRQGDPGETKFFVALDDDLVRRFGGEKIQSLMEWAGMDEDTSMQNKMISRSIENAQVKVEGYHFDIRKHLVDYDDVINAHRDIIYTQRDSIMEGANISDSIKNMMLDAAEQIIQMNMSGRVYREEEIQTMLSELASIVPLSEELTTIDPSGTPDPVGYYERFVDHIDNVYSSFEGAMGEDGARQIERNLMLRAIDENWVQHLTSMENLRQGIGLQAVGQRDPLVMYKKEGHDLFQGLQEKISSDVIHSLFRLRPEDLFSASELQKNRTNRRATGSQNRTPSSKVQASSKATTTNKIGRNEQCPCGSGKKYKRCCSAA